MDCPRNRPYLNPFYTWGIRDINALCVPKEDAEAVYVHTAGEDCIPGNEDDPHVNSSPQVTHVTGQN